MTGNSESGTTQCDGRVIHCTSVADIGLPYARGGGAYRCIDRFLALDNVSRVSTRIVYRENHMGL